MPELPEVETIRRALEPWLVGRTVRCARRVQAPRGPKYARIERASGQRILGVLRRGKFLVLPLSGGDEIVIHLGMSGALQSRRPRDHLRVELELDGPAPRRLFFRDPRRFGRCLVVRAGDYRGLPALERMGPEPLGAAFSLPVFVARLRTPTPVKVLLLGQRAVAGLGNIYADEALWRARVHPARPSSSLSRHEAARLRTAIRQVLTAAIAARGTTLQDYRTPSGGRGSFAPKLAAYGREAEPCLRCGASMAKIVLGARGTHFCPCCQRLPAESRGPRGAPPANRPVQRRSQMKP
jgi:formamidopyrimidine-DNA glycosylase